MVKPGSGMQTCLLRVDDAVKLVYHDRCSDGGVAVISWRDLEVFLPL
jgi:hypothetical protein